MSEGLRVYSLKKGDMMFVYAITAIAVSYFLGSIPTAYIFGKVLKGIDIREHGSGNVGATNAFRALGKGPAIAVFVIDFLKGLAAATVIPGFFSAFMNIPPENYLYVRLSACLAAVAGHVWTVFLNFKGGKGVATSAGVIVGTEPVMTVVIAAVWAAFFAVSRYVSLSSVAAAISLPIAAVIMNKDLAFVIFCAILSVLSVFTHRTNIRRLMRGEEKKIL